MQALRANARASAVFAGDDGVQCMVCAEILGERNANGDSMSAVGRAVDRTIAGRMLHFTLWT